MVTTHLKLIPVECIKRKCMKKKSARLKPVEQLAEKKAISATEKMVSARTEHSEHEIKLNELVSYRFEYIEQFQSRGNARN